MKRFRGLRWMPLEPELLDYENTQFLVIGEGMGNVEKATEEQQRDENDEKKEAPAEEMEKLEEEVSLSPNSAEYNEITSYPQDQIRIEHLKGDDPIFADLGLSSKEYPGMQTTW